MKTRDWQDQKENRERDLKVGDRVWYCGWNHDEPEEYEVLAVDAQTAALRAISGGDLRVERRGELYVSALVCGRRKRDGAYKDACRDAKRAEELYLSRHDRIESAYKAMDEATAELLAKDGVKVRKRYRMDIPGHAKTEDAVEAARREERERVLTSLRKVLLRGSPDGSLTSASGALLDAVREEAAKGQAK